MWGKKAEREKNVEYRGTSCRNCAVRNERDERSLTVRTAGKEEQNKMGVSVLRSETVTCALVGKDHHKDFRLKGSLARTAGRRGKTTRE